MHALSSCLVLFSSIGCYVMNDENKSANTQASVAQWDQISVAMLYIDAQGQLEYLNQSAKNYVTPTLGQHCDGYFELASNPTRSFFQTLVQQSGNQTFLAKLRSKSFTADNAVTVAVKS